MSSAEKTEVFLSAAPESSAAAMKADVEVVSTASVPMTNRMKGLVAMACNALAAILIIPFNKWLFKNLAFKWVSAQTNQSFFFKKKKKKKKTKKKICKKS